MESSLAELLPHESICILLKLWIKKSRCSVVMARQNNKFEPAHNKTYNNKACVTSKSSDQPVHLLSLAKATVYPSLDGPVGVEGTCDQRRLWSDCADAQADLSLRWSHKCYCRFRRAE